MVSRRIRFALALSLFLAGLALEARAQGLDASSMMPTDAMQSDTGLTRPEADQLYDATGHLHRQLTLLIKFANARLTAVDALCAEPPSAADANKIRALLEAFTSIVDRMGDTLDQYQVRLSDRSERADMRAGLDVLVPAYNRFAGALKPVLAVAGSSSAWGGNASTFRYALEDAEDTLRSSLGVAQAYLQDDQPTS